MGKFRLLVDEPDYDDVDTGFTVIASLTKRDARRVWAVLRNRAVTAVAALAIVSFHLSFTGRIQEPGVGWATAAALPTIMACVAFSNVQLVRYVTQTFLFWVIVVINCLFFACGVDMVGYAPHRVFALAVYWMSNMALLLFDARMLGNHKSYAYRWGAMAMCIANGGCGIIIGFLYMFGAVRVHNTPIVLLGDVSMPVASIGMCAQQFLVTFQLRCVWMVWASPRPNPLVLLYAPVSYVDAIVPIFTPRPSTLSLHEGGLSRPASFGGNTTPSIMNNGGTRQLSRPPSMHLGSSTVINPNGVTSNVRFVDLIQPMSPIGEEQFVGSGKLVVPAHLSKQPQDQPQHRGEIVDV